MDGSSLSICFKLQPFSTSLVALMVKNPPAMREIRVGSLDRESHQRRQRLPTPVFLPGEFHGQRSLAVYNLWGRKSRTLPSDNTLTFHFPLPCFIFLYGTITI